LDGRIFFKVILMKTVLILILLDERKIEIKRINFSFLLLNV